MPTDAQYQEMLYTPAHYDDAAKRNFHRAAKTLLQRLAKRLDQTWSSSAQAGYGEHDPIRSNKGGIAVSGEITLHYDRLYIQVSQSVMGNNSGILYRSCNGRKDYCGGQNHFAPLSALVTTEEFARLIESRIPLTIDMGKSA